MCEQLLLRGISLLGFLAVKKHLEHEKSRKYKLKQPSYRRSPPRLVKRMRPVKQGRAVLARVGCTSSVPPSLACPYSPGPSPGGGQASSERSGPLISLTC